MGTDYGTQVISSQNCTVPGCVLYAPLDGSPLAGSRSTPFPY
jgi:hypothetical protein